MTRRRNVARLRIDDRRIASAGDLDALMARIEAVVSDVESFASDLKQFRRRLETALSDTEQHTVIEPPLLDDVAWTNLGEAARSAGEALRQRSRKRGPSVRAPRIVTDQSVPRQGS